MPELEGKIEPGVQIVAKIVGSGPRGASGKDGYTPVKGVDYFDGAPGKDGRDGVDGKDGVDGRDGIDGKDGKDYVITEADYEAIAENAVGKLQPDIDEAKETAERAEVIAKGRATGYVFDTPEDLEAALANQDFVASLVVGDNFYIRALDVPDYWWDGTQKQQLEAEKPDLTDIVKDVQVDGTSIVVNGVANIPLCSNNTVGLVAGTNTYSMNVSTKGNLRAQINNLAQYNSRDGQAFVGKGTLENVKYDVVKRALSDGQGDEWTDEEKTRAWKRLTPIKNAMDEITVAGAQYYLGEQTEVSVVLPDDAQVGQMITVCWYNGTTPANLSVTGTMLNFDYTPSANTRSEISCLWDGTYWSVIVNEMSVPAEGV